MRVSLAQDIRTFMPLWHALNQQYIALGMPGTKWANRLISIGVIPPLSLFHSRKLNDDHIASPRALKWRVWPTMHEVFT